MRSQGWPALLAEQIEAARSRPFSFGIHDCLTFAADVAQALTGCDDPARHVRATYCDEWTCLRMIARFGSMMALAEHCFGPPIDKAFAQRGDIVMVLRDCRESLAVCVGSQVVAPGPSGIEYGSMNEVIAAWRI